MLPHQLLAAPVDPAAKVGEYTRPPLASDQSMQQFRAWLHALPNRRIRFCHRPAAAGRGAGRRGDVRRQGAVAIVCRAVPVSYCTVLLLRIKSRRSD